MMKDMHSQHALIREIARDALSRLTRAFEDAGLDATITRDEEEAYQLLETAHYDLILVGDHPPEFPAAAILDDLSLRGT